METSELIRALAADTRPVRSGEALGRLLVAVGLGGVAVALLVAFFLGDPLLGLRQLDAMTFGVKLGFTASLLLLGLLLLYQSGRPGHDPGPAAPWIAAPLVVMALVAAVALLQAPAGTRTALVFGQSWRDCLVSISLLAVPVFALLVWALRTLAATDLRLAGTLAGLVSGSLAALVYSLHCPEGSPVFLLVWYGLAIVIAAAVGRFAGPLLLRW